MCSKDPWSYRTVIEPRETGVISWVDSDNCRGEGRVPYDDSTNLGSTACRSTRTPVGTSRARWTDRWWPTSRVYPEDGRQVLRRVRPCRFDSGLDRTGPGRA